VCCAAVYRLRTCNGLTPAQRILQIVVKQGSETPGWGDLGSARSVQPPERKKEREGDTILILSFHLRRFSQVISPGQILRHSRAIAQAVSSWHLSGAPGSLPCQFIGFVVDKVTVGQVCLRVLRFPLSISLHRISILIYHHWQLQLRDKLTSLT
jgi:hypothetical protein